MGVGRGTHGCGTGTGMGGRGEGEGTRREGGRYLSLQADARQPTWVSTPSEEKEGAGAHSVVAMDAMHGSRLLGLAEEMGGWRCLFMHIVHYHCSRPRVLSPV